ncbi:putative ATP/GTP-binding protein [Marinobacter nitratireducens]|uniref:Putative ATP/GTP-binding protein n=1 Tax=Marinobacter nitratireducens TaxID=1137280 RepID=A0A072N131_9GAMM|nr:ATP-binding protein [Marinobacter nitratireducens]KEF30937.1 putative ATP/GTP-binding protein [Marinobacter nitratireducens]
MSGDDAVDWDITPAAVWRRHRSGLRAIRRLDPVKWESLTGIEHQQQALARNTERFLAGEPSNNALLWGARGTGKSSLIKALLNRYRDQGLRIIEVDKDDLVNLPEIVDDICDLDYRFVIFCDDLSFEVGESGYKALKSVLEGSLELPPENVRVYATSNRRHLMPEFMADNLKSEMRDGELHPAEAIEEQVSLADRFGLQLSFYAFSQQVYLEAVDALFPTVKDREQLHREAIRFAAAKGVRNGRTAQQFYRQFGGGQD